MTMTKASACFTVGGISGKHDVKEIKRELDTLPGVRSVTVSNGSLPVMKNGRKGRQSSGNKEWTEEQTDFQQ